MLDKILEHFKKKNDSIQEDDIIQVKEGETKQMYINRLRFIRHHLKTFIESDADKDIIKALRKAEKKLVKVIKTWED